MDKNLIPGTILKSLGGFYYVLCRINGKEEVISCRACGAFRQQNIKPCVGDFAGIELTDNNQGYVLEIGSRKNILIRPPLANLDQLILIVSIAEPPPNVSVLDKLIAIAEYQQIEPILVLTKSDLKDPTPFAQLYRKAGFKVYIVCSLKNEGIELLRESLQKKVNAFCGNSGSGKSSLLNALDPRLNLYTADISKKLGRGRHTTRQVELYPLEGGGFVADTPGFSSVDLERIQTIRKEELFDCFREFSQYQNKCRFTGCSHTKETGCAVLQAVDDEEISKSRHQSYCTLYEQARTIKEWELR